jgi:hypothetical protein
VTLGFLLPWAPPLWTFQVPPREYGEALEELARAEKSMDVDGFVSAFRTVLKGDDATSLRTAVAAYSRLAPVAFKKLSTREFMAFHGSAAGAFNSIQSKGALEEFRKLLVKTKDWHARLLILDASLFVKGGEPLECCLIALKDDSPVVVRRALQYLVRTKKPSVVEAIIERYVEISTKKLKGGSAVQWERTGLVFQSTLHQMLKVDLSCAEDYKNYVAARRDSPYLFEPKGAKANVNTRVTLFGAAITGKNIAFVLDISGSMLSTDPWPPGEVDPDQGKTAVVDPSKPEEPPKPRLDRQRMYRAKKELTNVIQALPSDVRFNIITFASEVKSWKPAMVVATSANKKSAVEYVEAMKAEGITFTDEGLETAFTDLATDTIYLLTDGAPTHIGTTKPGKPDDSDMLIRLILKRVEELNFLRGVRIFTLGFQGAEEEFLKKLSANNAGAYVRIK